MLVHNLLVQASKDISMPQRAILLAFALLVVAACDEPTLERVQVASGWPDASLAAEDDAGAGAAASCPVVRAPSLNLLSEVGAQDGVQGSYCGGLRDGECAVLTCADGPTPSPTRFTLAHPGDEVTLQMPKGSLVAGTGCMPACPPTLRLAPLCQLREEIRAQPVEEDAPWTVPDVAKGPYVLTVDTHVEGENGWQGSTTYAFGLLVDPTGTRAVAKVSQLEPLTCP